LPGLPFDQMAGGILMNTDTGRERIDARVMKF
jgi:hypothetical protein